MLTYHPLEVAELRPEASDALCIALEVPRSLREQFHHQPGQHIGLRATIDGREVRRTYSICSGVDEPQLRIGVRVQEHGQMSQHLAQQVRAGDVLEVMRPTGRFFVEPDATAERSYCAFACGSGITPILGILRNLLAREPRSRFFLFYGNRTTASIMFAEELLALKDRYRERLALNFIMSREPQDVELFNGRLDAGKIAELGRTLFVPGEIDAYYLCGPGTMIDTVTAALAQLGVDRARIHSEHFVSEAGAPRAATPARAAEPARPQEATQVTIVMDGRRRSFAMTDASMTVLEAGEQAGLELPYSCRAGVCSTCRARVVRGAVTMTANYALEPWEVEQGYVLCCQSLPASAELELSYDER